MLILVCIDTQWSILQTLRTFVRKLCHSLISIRKKINYYNQIAHDILMKEISLILPNFPKDRKEKRCIIAPLVTEFIRLAYESISSYLDNKRQKALQKAFMAMENHVNL